MSPSVFRSLKNSLINLYFDVRPLFISRTLNSPPIIPLVLLGAVHHATPQGSKRHPF